MIPDNAGAANEKRITGFVLVLISSFFCGFAPAVTQKAFSYGMSVETVLFMRFILGAIAIWTFVLLKRRPSPNKSNIVFLILLGVIYAIAIGAMNESYVYLPAAIASILVFSYIIMVNIIEMIMGRERVTSVRILCLILAVTGLVAVIWAPGTGAQFNIIGVIIALVAALFFAAHTLVIGAKRFTNIGSDMISALSILAPALINVVRCLSANEPLLPQSNEQWICMLFLGLGTSFIAPLCYIQAIKLIGASDSAITNTTEPVFAYIAGLILMSDHLSWNATVGGIIIMSAIVLLNVSKRKN